METCTISVTEASRNFSDCVNRARYQGTSFLLVKGGLPVARILPASRKPTRGSELADALSRIPEKIHLEDKEATSWLHDLEQGRGQAGAWHF